MTWEDPPKTYQGDYLILSLKWSDSADHLIWWQPDNSGYTPDLDKAGRYSAERVTARSEYYDNDETTRAVSLDKVLAGKLGQIQKIVASTFRYKRTSFDCHGCEREITHRVEFPPPSCPVCGDIVCDVCHDEGRCGKELEEVGERSAAEETGA